MLGRHVAAALHSSANTKLLRSVAPSFTVRLSIRVAPVSHRRLYATPSRPKKAVGETSRPIKRTTKAKSPEAAAAAKTAADAKKAAQKAATAEKNKLAKEKLKKTAADKKKATAAKKKAAAAAEKTKAAAAKKKAVEAKKKATEAKKKQDAAEKKKNKPLSLRQQQLAAKAEIAELKKAALNPPTKSARAFSPYLLFMKDHVPAAGVPQEERKTQFASSSRSWKSVTPAEHEHYNHLSNTKIAEAQAAYKAWVLAHSVEDIQLANKARVTLRQRERASKPSGTSLQWPAIEDGRAVRRPISPFLRFSINRQHSGDFKGIVVSEASKLISAEWKALPENEKKKYRDIYSKDLNEYQHAHPISYGQAATSQQAASAAA